ncbi:MAG: hypothetical protein ACR2HR_03350 [Euzebya sp.]
MSVVVLLDNEAVSVLLPGRRLDPKRRHLLARLEEADAVLVPTVVRIEANAPSTSTNADLGRLTRDTHLPDVHADDAIAVRAAVPTASVVDATLAAIANLVTADRVEVVTSDLPDLSAATAATVHVHHL